MYVLKFGEKRLQNRAEIIKLTWDNDYKSGQERIINWGKVKRLQIGARRLQIGIEITNQGKRITNWGRDYTSAAHPLF